MRLCIVTVEIFGHLYRFHWNKTEWQQFLYGRNEHTIRCWLCHIHRKIFLCKFGHKLTAQTARRRERVLLIGDHGNGHKFTMAQTDCMTECISFGTDGRTVRSVLHIASGYDFVGFGAYGWAHLKVTVRTVGIFAYIYRGLNQFLDAGIWARKKKSFQLWFICVLFSYPTNCILAHCIHHGFHLCHRLSSWLRSLHGFATTFLYGWIEKDYFICLAQSFFVC